ncbi:hypothetical protein D7193_25455 [Micromonospora costi]|uniref:DUF3592 domain-containing protein n=1 Tax=Micromonospora costi TaxID=1530042 RepID=A0A3A9ZY22_9ACTN|nr:hypothetical protein D7193_25455 [Micromonospora costi]
MARLVLVVLWVAWAASSWWSAPRQASTAQASSDLSAGRMLSYRWADGWDSTGQWGWTSGRAPRSTGRAGPLFLWRTGDWRVHYTEFDDGSTTPVFPGSFDATRYPGPEAAAFDHALQSASQQPRWQGADALQPLRALPMLLLLGILTVLVFGPAPARGTRWFWFWVLTGVPLGLGVIWWLARERPWYPAESPPPGPTGRDPRERWYVGLLIGIATSIVASLLLYGLRRVLGEGYVPQGAGS